MARLIKNFQIATRFYSSVERIKARKYVLTKYFEGEPKKSDFKIVEEELRTLKDGDVVQTGHSILCHPDAPFYLGYTAAVVADLGAQINVVVDGANARNVAEILTEAEYLSVDPYMRAYMIGYKLPTDMIGGQVAKIIESRNENFPVGKYVAGSFGWRTHTISNPTEIPNQIFLPLTLLPDLGQYPVSLGLGILGMPGNTSYFGLKEICKPKPGQTIVITGAAGAVGSHVGQIGKILGCRVVGFAGSDEKCEYLTKELGFDHAYNYKTANIRAALREGAPKKVDCYFDNVGGEISSTIMSYMNHYGRVAVCGSISSYNDSSLPKVTILQPSIVFKELKVEGFLVNRWTDRWDEGINANLAWLREGKLKYQEKTYHGFDNMVDALVGILRGENTGKAIVKVK